MSHSQSVSAPSAPHFAGRINRIPSSTPVTWLEAGWRDFCASPALSLAYGSIFVGAGLLLFAALLVADAMYLFLPLATGFVLVAPAAALGFYAISREIEAGRKPTFSTALNAFRINPGPLLYAGLALLVMFLVWLRLSQLAFALTFPSSAGFDIDSLMKATLTTVSGVTFLVTTFALGGVMAAIAFAGSAVALPMLLDRPVGFVEAVATSWTGVRMNIPAMFVWAEMLVVMIVTSMAAGFVGLALTLPLAGHATWHAYRAMVRPEGAEG